MLSIKRSRRTQRGQSTMEYALTIGIVALFATAAIYVFGTWNSKQMNSAASSVSGGISADQGGGSAGASGNGGQAGGSQQTGGNGSNTGTAGTGNSGGNGSGQNSGNGNAGNGSAGNGNAGSGSGSGGSAGSVNNTPTPVKNKK